MSAALRCAGLGHRYGRRLWGLRDCDLDVPDGRVVALIGPNGSGKTTLMSLAAGLLPATAWEEYKTVALVSWQASNIEPRNSRRASGSRLAIGSSSRNSSGFLARTRVRAT